MEQQEPIDWQQYVAVLAPVQGYALDAAQRERIAAQLQLIETVAQPLLAIALPADVEPASVFKP